MKGAWCCLVVIGMLAQGLTFAQQPSTGAVGGVAGDHPGGAPEMQGANPGRVQISSAVAQGFLMKKVPPEYPEDARRARIQGQVVMKALIDKKGNVQDLTLVSGHSMLVRAALKAVKQWKYKPYLLNGEAVAVETQIVVNFTLSPR